MYFFQQLYPLPVKTTKTRKKLPNRQLVAAGGKENFERHNFPRDSGCFASSSPASDRSSQQSASESGIHLPHDDADSADENADSDGSRGSPQIPSQMADTQSSNGVGVISRDLRDMQLKDAFEVLVEKYVTEKTPLHVETGRVSNTRSIFENHQI